MCKVCKLSGETKCDVNLLIAKMRAKTINKLGHGIIKDFNLECRRKSFMACLSRKWKIGHG